jgi:hypothetical protein
MSSILPQLLHCQLTGSAHTSQFDVDAKRVPHALHDHLLVKKVANLLVLTISFFSFSTFSTPAAYFRPLQPYSRRLRKSDHQCDRTGMCATMVKPYNSFETYESNHVICEKLITGFKHYRQDSKLCHHLFAWCC